MSVQLKFELTGANKKLVDNKIKEYLEQYPSAGYGTNIREPKYISERKLWIAIGTRGSSCD